MTLLKRYGWEVTHVTSIMGVIIILTLVTHLTGTPRIDAAAAVKATAIGPKSKTLSGGKPAYPVRTSAQPGAAPSQRSDPREIVVGASGISNRYTLLSVSRKPISSKSDELIVRLHVESLATEPLVSPFESDMLEIRSPGQQPITPSSPFRLPIPSGNGRNQDIAFSIPSSLHLEGATLQIHYYNYQNEIPLNLPARKSEE
jgi:hypothetical protein